MTQNWAIVLAEYPSLWGGEADIETFGQPFSHPFLIVYDGNGDVVEEFHGRWQNTIRTRQFVELDAEYRDARNGKPVTLPDFHPMAVVSPCVLRDAPKATTIQPVFEGSENVVKHHIENLRANIPMINDLCLPFYRYATAESGFANCQLILGAAIAWTDGFPPVPSLKLAYTGWTDLPRNAIRSFHDNEFA